jgi:hypothetical protein
MRLEKMTYRNRKNFLPFNISINRNEYFFAKLEWFLYEKFNKKRSIPCGRTEKDKYLCCCQPLKEKYCYISEDKHKAYCKCCGHVKYLSSEEIEDIDNLW